MDQFDSLTRDQLISLVRSLEAGRGGESGPTLGDPDDLPVFGERARREFEGSTSPMRIFDHETLKFLAVNDAAVKFYGYSREEFLTLTMKDTRHPDEHAAQRVSLMESWGYFRFGKPRRQVKKSGEIAVVEVITQDLLFDGRRARMTLTMDLTARLRMQEQLWRRQQEFESLADNLPDIVVRFDRDIRHIYVNAALEKVTGLSRAEFHGKTHHELSLPPDLADRFDSSMREIFETGRPNRLEFSLMTPDGERYFEAQHIPERDSSGEVRTALCVARDITAGKQARDVQSRLAAIVESSQDAIISRALDGTLLTWNRAAERLFGYTADEIVGRNVNVIIPPEIQHETNVRQALLLQGLEIPGRETVRIAKDGRRLPVFASPAPIRDSSGKICGTSTIIRDISERKRIELEIHRGNELVRLQASLAQAANEATSSEEAMLACLARICSYGNWVIGRVALDDGSGGADGWSPRSIWHTPDRERFSQYIKFSDGRTYKKIGPFVGRVLRERVAVWIEDLQQEQTFGRRVAAVAHGLRSAIAFPIIAHGEVVATMEAYADEVRAEDPLIMSAVQLLASQLARIVEREWAHQASASKAAIVESSGDAIVSRALDGRILTWNPAAERLFGYTAVEMVGKDLEILYPPELKPEMARRRMLLHQGLRVPAYETVRIAKDGRRIHVTTSSAAVRDSSGNVCGVSAIMRDNTERNRIDQALLESNEFLRSIIESSRDCIKVLDLDGCLRMISAGGQRLLQLDDASSLLGESYLDFWIGNDRDAADKALAGARMGETIRFEGYCPTIKGIPKWWDEIVSPILGKDGVPEKLLVVSRDVTDYKRADESLRESEERFRQLAENIRHVFWVNSKAGDQISYISPAYEEIWGRSRESLYRNPRSWMEAIHPDDLPAARDGQAGQARGEQTDVEYRITRPDGTLRWIRDQSYPMTVGGAIPLVCGIAEDVTDLKRAEQSRLTHAIQQRDALVREVHHRIKNNLQGVVGLLRRKIRKNPAITPDIEEAISQLHSVALVYGLQETRPDGMIALSEIVHEICGVAESLTGGRVEQTTERKSARPACVAGSEAVSVAVALNELVFNALKHQGGTGRKRARLALIESGDVAEIRIGNRGRLPKNFDFAGDRGVGHGLGLVRTLLAAPGGRIEFGNGRNQVEVVLRLAPPLLAARRKATRRRMDNGGASEEKAATAHPGRGRRPARAGRAG